MPQQGDFGLWAEDVRIIPKIVYGSITNDDLETVFGMRMLTAALLTQSTDRKEAFLARMVLDTLTSVKKELEEKITCHVG